MKLTAIEAKARNMSKILNMAPCPEKFMDPHSSIHEGTSYRFGFLYFDGRGFQQTGDSSVKRWYKSFIPTELWRAKVEGLKSTREAEKH